MKPSPAERHDHVRLLDRDLAIAIREPGPRLLRRGGVGGHEADAEGGHGELRERGARVSDALVGAFDAKRKRRAAAPPPGPGASFCASRVGPARRRMGGRPDARLLRKGPPAMLMPGFFDTDLATRDPEIAAAIASEMGRQRHEIELIASENIVSRAVLEAQGSVMTNKYAEGYPGKRYYGGCEFVDIAETLAIDRAKGLFGCGFANVQPNSGSQANQGVYTALLTPGDTILGMSLDAGGHLTHGAKPNQSGKWFNAVQYGVRRQDRCWTTTRSRRWRWSTGRRRSSPGAPRSRGSSTSRGCARSRTGWAPT